MDINPFERLVCHDAPVYTEIGFDPGLTHEARQGENFANVVLSESSALRQAFPERRS
jgi:hypothetical protein